MSEMLTNLNVIENSLNIFQINFFLLTMSNRNIISPEPWIVFYSFNVNALD